jgi:hypothetical protein
MAERRTGRGVVVPSRAMVHECIPSVSLTVVTIDTYKLATVLFFREEFSEPSH